MRISPETLEAWRQKHGGVRPHLWPKQNTIRAILNAGEWHVFTPTPHVLCARADGANDAHLISTSRRLVAPLPDTERDAIRELLRLWKPATIWFAWPISDRRIQNDYEAMVHASGLPDVTTRRLRYWSISGVKRAQLEALMDTAAQTTPPHHSASTK